MCEANGEGWIDICLLWRERIVRGAHLAVHNVISLRVSCLIVPRLPTCSRLLRTSVVGM